MKKNVWWRTYIKYISAVLLIAILVVTLLLVIDYHFRKNGITLLINKGPISCFQIEWYILPFLITVFNLLLAFVLFFFSKMKANKKIGLAVAILLSLLVPIWSFGLRNVEAFDCLICETNFDKNIYVTRAFWGLLISEEGESTHTLKEVAFIQSERMYEVTFEETSNGVMINYFPYRGGSIHETLYLKFEEGHYSVVNSL